jgi:Fe-S cluster assembly iron-binding protein IscA
MLTITEKAAAELAAYMQKSGQGKAVRIKLRSGG